ncbi:MAG: S41 family peptidase [Bacteroidota bacterium]
MRSLFLSFFFLCFLLACQTSPPNRLSLNGTWQSLGSGWILAIQDSSQYQFFDQTSISCLPARTGELPELLPALRLQNDTLILHKGVLDYTFIRTDQLPVICNQPIEETKQHDPVYNFAVFAETVEEHYAFFDLNEIDWPSLYEEQKAQLSPNSTSLELYQVIEETLEALNDNHAYLEADAALYAALEEEETEEKTEDGLPEYGDFQVSAMVAENHFEEEFTQDSWLVQWGTLSEDIGMIVVKAMWLYADLDIPQARIDELGYVDAYVTTFHELYEGDYIQKEVAGIAEIMDRVMDDLRNHSAIVIDLRFNGGGQDAVSFEILSRFLDQETAVATQKLRMGEGFTLPQTLSIPGHPQAFTKPVYLLTSPQTGSAAEAFAIAALPVEHIKRIGGATQGAMSTALEKTLPNEWSFSISNEIYMDLVGKSYENIGIPVDYDCFYSKTFNPAWTKDLSLPKSVLYPLLSH